MVNVTTDDAQQAISVTLPSSILQSYTAQNWESFRLARNNTKLFYEV